MALPDLNAEQFHSHLSDRMSQLRVIKRLKQIGYTDKMLERDERLHRERLQTMLDRGCQYSQVRVKGGLE